MTAQDARESRSRLAAISNFGYMILIRLDMPGVRLLTACSPGHLLCRLCIGLHLPARTDCQAFEVLSSTISRNHRHSGGRPAGNLDTPIPALLSPREFAVDEWLLRGSPDSIPGTD
ncbi:MAG: hypothetical protein R3D29_15000 [Nitratireductor sp.]